MQIALWVVIAGVGLVWLRGYLKRRRERLQALSLMCGARSIWQGEKTRVE